MLVLTTFILVTIARKNASENDKNGKYLVTNLVQVLYIWYHITFQNKSVLMLFDLKSEVNSIHLIFVKELNLSIWPINIRAQKIENIALSTYEIVVVVFSITYKANWIRFFEEIFLMANVSPEIVFGMLFLILRDANINFWEKKLR